MEIGETTFSLTETRSSKTLSIETKPTTTGGKLSTGSSHSTQVGPGQSLDMDSREYPQKDQSQYFQHILSRAREIHVGGSLGAERHRRGCPSLGTDELLASFDALNITLPS